MRFKQPILMIIVMFLFLHGQLWPEEIVGTSIFPNIETPHPYPEMEGDQSLVWSTTIEEPGATWIKIHFSSFQLNVKDFVNLIDEEGRIVEHIEFRNVNGKNNPRFKSQKNDDQTVNFWTLAVDGQKIRVELHRKSNKITGWGFTIDEIGIGSRSLYDRGLGPIYNNDLETGTDFFSSLEKNRTDFDLRRMINPVGPTGRMLYKRGTTWFTSKGNLLNGSKNEFSPREDIIDSPEIIDTIEVRFYFYCPYKKNDTPVYQNFYGDKIIDNYIDSEFALLTLKRNDKRVGLYQKDGKPAYKSQLSKIAEVPDPDDVPQCSPCCNCGSCK